MVTYWRQQSRRLMLITVAWTAFYCRDESRQSRTQLLAIKR